MNETPLVSIDCITYNHAPYIRQCLEGFMMQRTTFPFEVLIHDDASTDGTPDIIREYELKYPEVIKPIYQSENQYSKGVRISATFNFSRAKGKYIALCEGDDYWIDPLKLQMQVDFLENNVDVVLSHTDCNILYQKTGKISQGGNLLYSNNKCQDVFEQILAGTYLIRTASVLTRTSLLKKIYGSDPLVFESNNFKMGDTPLWLELSKQGDFYYIPKEMIVYRVSIGSACRPRIIKDYYRFQLSIYELRLYYIKKYNVVNTMLISKIQCLYMKNLFRYKCFDYKYKSADFIDTSFLCKRKMCSNHIVIFFIRLMLIIRHKISL